MKSFHFLFASEGRVGVANGLADGVEETRGAIFYAWSKLEHSFACFATARNSTFPVSAFPVQ